MNLTVADKRQYWVLERLKDAFSTTTFEHLPEYHQFRATFNGGFQNIIYSFSHYDDLSIVELFMGIRHDAIEQLAHPFTQGLQSFTNESNTVVASIKAYQEGGFERFKVTSPQTANDIVEQTTNFLTQEGFLLLDHLKVIQSVDQLLNDLSISKHLWSLNPFNRAVRGITAARLVFRPDFDFLIQHYKDDLERRYTIPEMMERYMQLAKFLETYSMN